MPGLTYDDLAPDVRQSIEQMYPQPPPPALQPYNGDPGYAQWLANRQAADAFAQQHGQANPPPLLTPQQLQNRQLPPAPQQQGGTMSWGNWLADKLLPSVPNIVPAPQPWERPQQPPSGITRGNDTPGADPNKIDLDYMRRMQRRDAEHQLQGPPTGGFQGY